MPGLPRSRRAREQRRLIDSDRSRASDVVVIGALTALVFVGLGLVVPVGITTLVTVVAAGRLALRAARRQTVLAALGEEIGGVVVVSEGGEHGTSGRRHGARCVMTAVTSTPGPAKATPCTRCAWCDRRTTGRILDAEGDPVCARCAQLPSRKVAA